MTTATPAPARPPAPRPRIPRLLHPDPVVRRLAWMTLVNAFGNGLFMTVGVLFFTRALHFRTGQVGLGLTVAGVCGVLASVPAGRAADRWGTRRVLTALLVAEAIGTACYGLVHGFTAFVLLAGAVTAADRGSAAVRGTLYAQALPKDVRVKGRGYLRAVTNVAMGAGAGVAVFALHSDTRQAYLTAILADAATFVVAAVMLASVPLSAPVADAAATGTGVRAHAVLRDLPFLAVTLLCSLLMLQFAVIEVGVPLWLVRSTRAPRELVAPLLIINTALVVLFQMRATRGTEEPRSAARAFRRGALLTGAFCLVNATAHGLPPLAASLILVAAAVLQSLGEVLTQAAGWALSYELAQEASMGAYQGVFNAGFAAATTLGPALVTMTVLSHGLAGWALLAALFSLSGLAMGPAIRWARQRQAALAA